MITITTAVIIVEIIGIGMLIGFVMAIWDRK